MLCGLRWKSDRVFSPPASRATAITAARIVTHSGAYAQSRTSPGNATIAQRKRNVCQVVGNGIAVHVAAVDIAQAREEVRRALSHQRLCTARHQCLQRADQPRRRAGQPLRADLCAARAGPGGRLDHDAVRVRDRRAADAAVPEGEPGEPVGPRVRAKGPGSGPGGDWRHAGQPMKVC